MERYLDEESRAGLFLRYRQGEVVGESPNSVRRALSEIAVALEAPPEPVSGLSRMFRLTVSSRFPEVVEARRDCEGCGAPFRTWHSNVNAPIDVPSPDLCRRCRSYGPGRGGGMRNTNPVSCEPFPDPTEGLERYLREAGAPIDESSFERAREHARREVSAVEALSAFDAIREQDTVADPCECGHLRIVHPGSEDSPFGFSGACGLCACEEFNLAEEEER